MGMVYCRRVQRVFLWHSNLVTLGFFLSAVLVGVSAFAQAELINGAVKVADLAHDKGIVWMAMFALVVTIIYAGLLTKVLISMAMKFLEASEKNAAANTAILKSHDDQTRVIQEIGHDLDRLTNELKVRPCSMQQQFQMRPKGD